MGKGGPNDMYNNDGSRASYDVWMDWIDEICSEDLRDRLKKMKKGAREGSKDGA